MRRQTRLRMLALLTIATTSGCVWVRPTSVSPEISADQAKVGGLPKDTLDYFEEKYPPDTWKPSSNANRVAVGPAYLSREAVVLLTGDDPEELQARVESGTSRAVVTVRKGGQIIGFYIEAWSQEVQAIVVDELAKHPGFRVFSINEPNEEFLVKNAKSFKEMRHEGIHYYVDGTVKADDDAEMSTRVYLRFRDTLTNEIVCATYGEGRDVPSAARGAAVSLAQSLNPPDAIQQTGG